MCAAAAAAIAGFLRKLLTPRVADPLPLPAISAKGAHMIWFLERESRRLTCEIRRAPEGEVYEFEVAPADGPAQTRQYTSARELIDQYLYMQVALRAQGWRPRAGEPFTLD
jgi:hypothetical protein